MPALDSLALVLFIACLLSFSWARRWFFVRAVQTEKGRRGLGPLGTIFGLVDVGALGCAKWHGVAFHAEAAIPVFIVALGGFWWAVTAYRTRRPAIAHTPGVPDLLVIDGPYRWVRPPFYLSYILAWLGAFFAVPVLFTFLPIPVMTLLYARTAKSEEEALLNSRLGEQYASYMARTGRFLPRVLM